MKVLVEAGANPDTKDSLWDGTPLGWAAYGERIDVVKYLEKIDAKE